MKNQFRGVHVPPIVLQKLTRREINVNEFTFLLWIDSKVNHLVDPPEGDFELTKRENRRIQRVFKQSPSWAENKIDKLAKTKLLIKNKVGEKIYARTLWSRPETEVVEVSKKRKTKKTNSKKKKRKRNAKSRWKPYAEQLHEAVTDIVGIDRSHNLHNWADSFRLLHEQDGVREGEIVDMLDWYCNVVENGDKYLPQAYSGRSFRDKYPRLVAAKKRYEEEDEQDAKPTKVIVEEDEEEIDDEEWELSF